MDGSSLRIPDGIEPISAFRAWSYTMGSARATLHSLGGGGGEPGSGPWVGAERGWVTARCRMGIDHPGGVPDEQCFCGFYSMKSLPALLEFVGVTIDASESDDESGVIVGRIQIAGKIIEHNFGYRAERARVAELIPRAANLANETRLADLLGLPVTDTILTIGPPPSPRWLPPDGPSSIRLPVSAWVQEAA